MQDDRARYRRSRISSQRRLAPAPEYQPPARWPLAGAAGFGGLRGQRAARARAMHVELFANQQVIVVPGGIGVSGGRTTLYGNIVDALWHAPAWSLEPGGVVHLEREGVTLGDVFADLGPAELGPDRLLTFTRARSGRGSTATPRSGDPASIVLRDRDQVVLVHGGDVEIHRTLRLQARPAITADMAQRTRPPFRADHVGSLLRPDRLRDARAAFKAGRATADGARGRRGRRDPRGDRAPARRRPADGHRRRAAPHLMAHGLHLLARRDHAGRGRVDPRPLPQRGGRVRLRAARDEGRRARSRCARRSSRRRSRSCRPTPSRSRRRS